MAITVTDAPDKHRYEVRTDGELAGFAAYVSGQGVRVFTHTEVDPAYEGQGLGSTLARGALDDVRQKHVAAVPMCPFIASWIERHPDYSDVVYRRPQSRVSD